MAIGFNANVYEKINKKQGLIGKLVCLHQPTHDFVGRVEDLNDSEITLRPYRGSDYVRDPINHPDKNGHRSALLYLPIKISLTPQIALEEVTEDWVVNKISHENEQLEKPKTKEDYKIK